jgi:hypothetical protein
MPDPREICIEWSSWKDPCAVGNGEFGSDVGGEGEVQVARKLDFVGGSADDVDFCVRWEDYGSTQFDGGELGFLLGGRAVALLNATTAWSWESGLHRCARCWIGKEVTYNLC